MQRLAARHQQSPSTCLRAVLYAAAIASAVAAASPALAQDTSAPTRIDRAGAESRQQKRPTVRVEELGAPGAGSTGTLSDSEGGLGINLWRGAPLAKVTGLMRQLPAANRSPILHELQRRLLLTVALAPAGTPAADFARARLDALMTMGASKDVVDLAARLKTAPAKPFPVIRARFLTGDEKGACALAKAAEKADAFIEAAQIACHALGGEGERAEIALRLLHEQGTPPDKAFETAVMAVVAGEQAKGLGKPYALTVALLAKAKTISGAVDLQPVPTGALVALSANTRLSRLARIRALEVALSRGAPVDSDLSILYAGANASADKIAAAHRTRLRRFDVRARMHLYLAAAAADSVPKRLRVLSAWWRLAAGAAAKGDTGAEMLAARQTTPFLRNIKPNAAHQDHAAHIARAYFATGRVGTALAWYKALKSAPFRNPADLHRITALAVLSAPSDARTIEGWYAFKKKLGDRTAKAHLADLKALLEGLGRMQAFTRLWDRVAASDRTGGGDQAGDYQALREAAATRQRGMTVLHVLTLVNGQSLHQVPRALLREAVTGLRVVGLEREARQLALEAALARQL